VVVSGSAEKHPRERGETYKWREPATRRTVHDLFYFEAFTGVPKVKGGDLECGRCWGGIVAESTRAGWSEDSSRIPDPSADCELA
jgi:hypothetical protein